MREGEKDEGTERHREKREREREGQRWREGQRVGKKGTGGQTRRERDR